MDGIRYSDINLILKPKERDGIFYTDYYGKMNIPQAAIIYKNTSQEYVYQLAKQDVKALVIIDVLDFSFLAKLVHIENVVLIYDKALKRPLDFEKLYPLPLKTLIVNYYGSYKFDVKFELSKIPSLERLRINYSMLGTIGKNNSITSLDLYGLGKSFDLTTLMGVEGLEYLCLTDGSVTIDDEFCGFNSLKSLTLKKISAQNFNWLKQFKKLKNFRIDGVFPATIVDPLGTLTDLEYLRLDGYVLIDDVYWLKNLKKLKTLILGCVVKNGDLSCCKEIPYVRLKVEEENYNLRDKDLSKKIVDKHGSFPYYKEF